MSQGEFQLLRYEIQVDNILRDIQTFKTFVDCGKDPYFYQKQIDVKEVVLKECRQRIKLFKIEAGLP